LEQGASLYDPQQNRAHAAHYSEDPGVACLSYAALTLWLQGYPDQALTCMQAALTLAQQQPHRFSLGRALVSAAWLHQLRREARATHERAEAAMTLSTEQGFPHWLMVGTFLRGWALAAQGQTKAGIAEIRQGMERYRATGATLASSWFLGMLAEAHGQDGLTEEGLSCVAEALMVIERTGEGYHAAEIHRLKGELLLRQGGAAAVAQAEACLRRALAVARRQGAKSHELRSGTSLARLWCKQGKQREAYRLLAPMYDWFTEGFDTPDLQEARRWLDDLSTES